MKKKTKRKTPPSRARAPKPNWAEAIIVDHNRFRRWPGVSHVGIGIKEVKGKLAAKYCVKFYVRSKGELAQASDRIPAKARVLLPIGKGLYRTRWVPTDVVQASSAIRSSNPVRSGDQLGVIKGGGQTEVGTLTFIGAGPDGATACLTAGHVISDQEGTVPLGVPVNQPAQSQPGEDAFLGSTTDGFVGPQPGGGPYVDWALVSLDGSRQGDGTSARDPNFSFTRTRLPESTIVNGQLTGEMLGAQSGSRTTGKFSAVLDLPLQSGELLHNVMEFKSPEGTVMARKGDSGALMVSRSKGSQGEIIGMVCAASDPPDDRAYVFPLVRVSELDEFFD